MSTYANARPRIVSMYDPKERRNIYTNIYNNIYTNLPHHSVRCLGGQWDGHGTALGYSWDGPGSGGIYNTIYTNYVQ